MAIYKQIIKDLETKLKPEKQLVLHRFFKTGPGQYGEGDVFMGVVVPDQRAVAQQYYRDASLVDVNKLLASQIHEHRLTALIMLTYQFPKADLATKRLIYEFYLGHTQRINNWDLVDLSAPNIVGEYMLVSNLDMNRLIQLAQSPLLWERRISIIATLAFIRAVKKGRVSPEWLQSSLKLAKLLLMDKQDLMHKAVGWVLREVGKADKRLLREFLDNHYQQMPRTTLRYSIERLNDQSRLEYLKK